MDEAKEEVSELVEFLNDPKKLQKLGGHIPKGVLMVGPYADWVRFSYESALCMVPEVMAALQSTSFVSPVLSCAGAVNSCVRGWHRC